jgi:hypothetical protein
MKILLLATLLAPPLSAMAMQHFLTADWYENGNHFCKYDDGSVMNVGVNVCTLSI